MFVLFCVVLSGSLFPQTIHGSFAFVLETQGREALELQLERFFTVWAWQQNMAGPSNFRDLFGQLLCLLSLPLWLMN